MTVANDTTSMNPIDVRKDDSSADAELVDDEADDDPTDDAGAVYSAS